MSILDPNLQKHTSVGNFDVLTYPVSSLVLCDYIVVGIDQTATISVQTNYDDGINIAKLSTGHETFDINIPVDQSIDNQSYNPIANKAVYDRIASITSNIQNISGSLYGTVNSVSNELTNELTDTIIYIANEIKTISNTITGDIDTISNTIIGDIDTISKSVLTNLSTQLTGLMNTLSNSLSNSLTGKMSTISNDLTGIVNDVSGNLTGIVSNVSGDLTGIVNDVSGDLTGLMSDVSSELTTLSTINCLNTLFSTDDFDIDLNTSKVSIYKPITINSFTISPYQNEIGTKVSEITCKWKLNKSYNELSITSKIGNNTINFTQLSVDNIAQSTNIQFNNDNNEYSLNLKLSTDTNNDYKLTNSNRTFALSVTDNRGLCVTKSATYTNRLKYYYGASTFDAPPEDFASFLASLSSDYMTSEIASTSTIGEKTIKINESMPEYYFYFIYPYNTNLFFKADTGFQIAVVNNWTKTVTNNAGYSYTYKIYRSSQSILYTTTPILKFTVTKA